MGVPIPAADVSQAWLEQHTGKPVSSEVLRYAGGAPLRALACNETSFATLRQTMFAELTALSDGSADLVQLAQSWAEEKQPLERVLERLHWLDYWVAERIQREIFRNADPVTRQTLQEAEQVLNIRPLFQVQDKLRELKSQLRRTAVQRELALITILTMVTQALQART